jgi:hypothetical protein
VSLLTGVQPAAHGITGNRHWPRTPGAPPALLDDAALIEVQTLFTVAEEHDPTVATLGAFAKPKVARLFSAAPGRQRAPDRLWSSDERPSPSDDATMTAALGLMERPEPDLAVIALAGVDRAAHRFGPAAPECEQAVALADAALGRLLDEIRRLGRWGRSIVIVTADHGFSPVAPTAEAPYPVVSFGRELLRAKVDGVRPVADGRLEHVYVDGIDPAASDAGASAAVLRRVAELAAATPGVAEVLARLETDGVASLARAHPDWHVGHPRSGELLLVAARGHHFVDPFDVGDAGLLGSHGGPEDNTVPLFVLGGAPQIAAAGAGAAPPASVDVAPTIATLLGLPLPRRVDGSPVPAGLAGRVIATALAPPSAQSPH